MAAITLPEARNALTTPRVTALISPLVGAVETWRTLFAALPLDESTRAAIIHNLHYDAARAAVTALPDSGTGDYRGQRYLRFDDELIVRLKHLDPNLASRNYPTRQAREFVTQAVMDGFPAHRLHLGYRLDITGRHLEDAFITLPSGRRLNPNRWVWQVWGDQIDLSTYGSQIGFPGMGQPAAATAFYYEDFRNII